MTLIPLKDGTDYEPDNDFLMELQRAYQGIDLEFQFKKMRIWCLSNASRRKTRRGIKRFINNWLARNYETHSRPRLSKSEQVGNAIFGPRSENDQMDMGQDGGTLWGAVDQRDLRRQGQCDQTGGMGGATIEVRREDYQGGCGSMDGEISTEYSRACGSDEAHESRSSALQKITKAKT